MIINFSKKKNIIKFAVIYFSIIFLTSTKIFLEEIILNAENILYDKQNNKVFAYEKVSIKYKDVSLATEYLEYDVEKNEIYITTYTTLSYYGNQLMLQNLVYNITNDTLAAKGFYVYYSPWYSYSKEANLKKEEFLLDNAKVTHCDLKYPHYHFYSKKVIIYPQKKIKLYSPKLFIKKIPVLWFPCYEISLKPTKDCFIIEPGYDSYNGYVMKTKYIRTLSDNNEVRILIDPYSSGKIGFGNEYRYNYNTNTGVVYIYYVSGEKNTQWNFKFNNLHKFKNFWSLRSNLELLSNEQLYYFYEKENWYLIKREVNSSLSLSKDTQKNSFRLSYLRKDSFSQQEERFINNYFQTPIEFLIYPFKINKLVFSENIKIIPEFIEGTTYYKIYSENNFNTSLPLRFTYLSLTPYLGLKTIYTKSGEVKSLYYNIYDFIFPIRYNILSYGSFDLKYNYSIRSLDNSFEIIFSSNNIVKNNISSNIDLYYKIIYFRTSTAYNFLNYDNSYWLKNFTPIISDLVLNYKFINFNINSIYNVKNERLQNINLSLGYLRENNIFSVSYGKNFYQPDISFLSFQIGIFVVDNFQIKLRSTNNINKERFDLVNANLEFYKDLHCWETKIFCNIRKSQLNITNMEYIFEIGGYVGLKFKPIGFKDLKQQQIDKQYFPWRE
ncbi:MAG: hypothetical protein ACK4WJ_00930 [Endomicrobiia bacterium]